MKAAELKDMIARDDPEARMQLRAIARQSLFFYMKVGISYKEKRNLFEAETFKERQDFIQRGICEWKRILIEDPRAHIKSWGCTVAVPPPWIAMLRPFDHDPSTCTCHGRLPQGIRCRLCSVAAQYGMLDSPDEVVRANAFLKDHPHLLGVDSRIVCLSDSKVRGGKWVNTVKSQLESNEFLRWLHPELVWENTEVREYGAWNQYEIYLPGRENIMLTDGFFRASGLESKEQGGRADGIFVEDIVGEQSYKSATELEKRRDALDTFTNILEDNDPGSKYGGFVVVNGNRWCLDDVNSKIHDSLQHYQIWRRGAYKCHVHLSGNCGRWHGDAASDCAPTESPLWTARYPDKDSLMRVEQDKGAEVFAAQWLNDPTRTADLDVALVHPFTVEIVQLKDPETSALKRMWCARHQSATGLEDIPLSALRHHVISIDPAASQDVRAARTAIIWAALDIPTRRRFWLDCVADRFKPADTPTKVVDLWIEVKRKTGASARIVCEKVAAQDFVASAVMREAKLREIQGFPQVEMIPVPRGERKTDRNKRRIGDLLGNNLLYIREGLQLPRYEIRHHPSGTQDTLDAFNQADGIFQGFNTSSSSTALAKARRRRKRRRLQSATTAGVSL